MPVYQDKDGSIVIGAGSGDLVFRSMRNPDAPEKTALLVGTLRVNQEIGSEADRDNISGYPVLFLFHNRESLGVFAGAVASLVASLPPRDEALAVAAEPIPVPATP